METNPKPKRKTATSVAKQPKETTQEQPKAKSVTNPPPVASKHKLATGSGDYGGIQVVTSNRLKRRFCNSGYETSLYIPDGNYNALSIDGLHLGVTMDEIIRGLIEQHLASTDRLNGLKHFIPALQV